MYYYPCKHLSVHHENLINMCENATILHEKAGVDIKYKQQQVVFNMEECPHKSIHRPKQTFVACQHWNKNEKYNFSMV